MKNKIDIRKVPIKIIIGANLHDENFPTEDDLIYLVTLRAEKKLKNLENLEFTRNFMMKSLPKEVEEEKIEKSINSLIDNEIIEVLRETKSSVKYRINKNKFI